jgi:hypothetical protein
VAFEKAVVSCGLWNNYCELRAMGKVDELRAMGKVESRLVGAAMKL